MPTTCDEQAIIDSIVRQLSNNSPCGDTLDVFIPALWELVAQESCGSLRLRTLLAKREALLLLMGCEAYSVDTYDRHREMTSVTVADSVTDSRSQSQSTGSSSRFSRGHGETRYDEVSNARSSTDMDRHDRSTETGDGTSFYRDDGSGNGFNNSQSSNSIDSRNTRFQRDEVSARSREVGYRTDCNYEYSTSNSNGAGASLILALGSFTGSGNEWRKFLKTRASDTDTSFRDSTHYMQHVIDDIRDEQGTHDWLSQFLADIEWSERDFDIRISRDRTDRRQHSEAHSRGDGDGMNEEKSEGRSSSQGTAKSETTSSTKRTIRRTDHMTTLQLANSQRFRNLQLIYDQMTTQIDRERRRVRARAGAYVAVLPCICSGCCQCGPSLRSMGYAALGHVTGRSGSSDMLW